ncbi:MAG: Soluble epoxide hydrolase [Promethearchaeota archaeon]|nr:MAG: Soluble epoxide hydrolase [Candidatus Lokiarchaeota archaeon]
MPFADVNEIQLYYEIHGEGYPLFMLHGYGATSKVWIAQIDALSEHFKVITYDQRSSGKSEHPNEDYKLDTLVEDLKGLMEFLKVEKTHLMGQSMGGWVSQNFVLKYPDKGNKLVLIGTNHKGAGLQILKNTLIDLHELAKNDKEEAFWKYAKLMHHRSYLKAMQENPSKRFYDLWSAEDLIEEFIGNNMVPEDYERFEKAGSMHDVLDRLSEITQSAILIGGANDKMSPKLVLDQMHEALPNSQLEIIDRAGHHVFIEVAPTVNQLIIDFLKE